MRIGKTEIRRLSAGTTTDAEAAPTDDVNLAAPHKEQGGSGTVNMGGYLSKLEYNPQLRGRNGYPVFEQMVWSDASVREAEGHIFEPIINAHWYVEPASTEPLELEKAEFVRRALFDYQTRPWEQTLRQILKYLRYGSMVFELPEMVVEDVLEIDLPKPSMAPPASADEAAAQAAELQEMPSSLELEERQFLVWRRFAPRMPKTIYRWNLDEFGDLESVTQQVWSNVRKEWVDVDLPAENLIVFTNDIDGEDFEGVSLLRSAYKAWVLKELFEKVAGMAFERHGVGVLTVYLPEARANDEEFRQEIEDILDNLRAGEATWAIWPYPKATSNRDGITFEIVGPPGTLPDFKPYLDYFRAEIKASVLARFAELGHGTVGARSTADVQQQVWYDALHSVAKYVCSTFKPSIKQLADKNYPSNGKYPELKATDIEAESLLSFAEGIAALVGAGALTMDRGTRRWVRETVDAPEEDMQEELAEKGEQLRQQEAERDALAHVHDSLNGPPADGAPEDPAAPPE